MFNYRYFSSAVHALFIVFLFSLSAQSFAQAVARDDLFEAADLSQINDPMGECGVTYVLDPLANDTVITPDYNAMAQGITYVSGPQFGQLAIDFQSSVPQFIYFPSCPSDGSFSTPAVYTYTLVEANDPNSPSTAQITINPPPQASTNPDTYSADPNNNEVTAAPGPGTDQTTYTLIASPLANDVLNPPYDEAQTINATDNFIVTAGGGSFQAVRGRTGPEFRYTADDALFTGPVTVSYDLRDNQGASIPNTGTTITITPPASGPVAVAVDDVYDIDTGGYTEVLDNGVTGYLLTPDPFGNDELPQEFDLVATVNAPGNFAQDGGDGTLRVELDQNNNVVMTYFPGTAGPSLFYYDLFDANGDVLNQANAEISISGLGDAAPVVDAQDDVVQADDLQTVNDPETNEIGYRFDPFANDFFAGQDPSNLDLIQTLDAGNFVAATGTAGDIQATNNNGVIEVTYFPRGAFTQSAVFNYTLYDQSGNTDSASITINPPGSQSAAPPVNPDNDINDACAIEIANGRLPAFCDNSQITANERLMLLSTITAQSDALFGMQGDLIDNIRQRMNENRSVYNPVSVAGLNSNLYGKGVPIGRIAQEMIKPLTGGGAADDFANSGRLGFFLNGNFSAGERDETGLTGGYDQDGYNFTSGIDYRLSLNLVMGAAFGIAKEDTEFVSSRGEQTADATSFSFYGNYFPSNALYADWLFMLTQGDLDIDRNAGVLGEVAQGNTDGDLWSFAGTVGYHWNSGPWEMDGYSRVEYTSLEIDQYSETGSSFNLTVFDQEAESLEAALGFKVARVVSLESGVLVPSFDIEWLGQFEDDARFIGVNMAQLSTGFAVEDEGADSSYFNAAFSLSSVFANGFSAYFRIDSQLADDHIGRTRYGGGLRWEF